MILKGSAILVLAIMCANLSELTMQEKCDEMLDLIIQLRLPGVPEVDARLSESPGEAQIELAGAVPGFVVLVVVFGISIPRRAIISVLEGHDSRSSQDKPVLEETLSQAQGILIVNAVVGALESGFSAGDAAGGKSHRPFPKHNIATEVESPFHTGILLVQAWRIEVIVTYLRRRLEAKPLARIPVETHHLVDMIVGNGILIGGDLDAVRIDLGEVFNLVAAETPESPCRKVPVITIGAVCERQGV